LVYSPGFYRDCSFGSLIFSLQYVNDINVLFNCVTFTEKKKFIFTIVFVKN